MQSEEKTKQKMKGLLIIFGIFLLVFSGKTQDDENKLLIISIEKRTNRSVHKLEKNYWAIPQWEIEGALQEAILPLFIDGYSGTDLTECCQESSLTLFNYTKEEDFTLEDNYEILENIIKKHGKKIQVAKKIWAGGAKEKIKVYITPVEGKFCVCEILDARDNTNAKVGYIGNIVVPFAGLSYAPQFWHSSLDLQIAQFDYLKLPFLQLHLIQ